MARGLVSAYASRLMLLGLCFSVQLAFDRCPRFEKLTAPRSLPSPKQRWNCRGRLRGRRLPARLRRMQTPEDIGDAVVFFASPAARNITGQALNVDGGFLMN